MSTIKSARDFDAAVSSKERGEAIVYHAGLLMRDRQSDDKVHSIASRAWSAMEAGAVALVQRRLEPGVCSYMAVKL